MARLQDMLTGFFTELKEAVGVKDAKEEEAARGHVKGMQFEEQLYGRIAALGRELGDDTELVRGLAGTSGKKTGDCVITLGETTGAPGLTIVVEAKKQPYRFNQAMDELQEAKKNREAVCGIFVFAKGCEPVEVGDFRRVGEDILCTADADCLANGDPLLFVEAAYKIARAQSVAAVRKEAASERDLQRVAEHIGAIESWLARLSEIATKASTVKKNGEAIESLVKEMKDAVEDRIEQIYQLLRA